MSSVAWGVYGAEKESGNKRLHLCSHSHLEFQWRSTYAKPESVCSCPGVGPWVNAHPLWLTREGGGFQDWPPVVPARSRALKHLSVE